MNSNETDILLVEDSQDDADLALHALRREHLANNIFIARDGEEALDFLFCRAPFAERSFNQPPKLELLTMLAGELGKLPNKVSIEGHTDSKPYVGLRDYGNWELSADRANAARRLMQHDGLGQDQVSQVRGFADQKLRKKDSPLDPSNRRITLIVQYLSKDNDQDVPLAGDSPEGKPETKAAAPAGH